jgi:hypothetical protein
MTWFRVDDGFYDHPKVKSLPRGAVRKGAVFLWTTAGSWAARYLMDGLVPALEVEEFGASSKDAQALVAARLWHDADNGCTSENPCPPVPPGHFLFHQWPVYQWTRQQVEADRAAARARQQRRRHKPPDTDGTTEGVTP